MNRAILLICISLCSKSVYGETPSDGPGDFDPAVQPANHEYPAHWFDRNETAPHVFDGYEPPPPPNWVGNLFIRADAGIHDEIGFPERLGAGVELAGRLPLPEYPWISILGELRDEILEGSNRISWTVGGVSEKGPWQFAFGIDGIYDSLFETNTGSVFLMVGYHIAPLNSQIGLWTTGELWDDLRTTSRWLSPTVFEVTSRGAFAYEQTSIFYSAGLGPDGSWGELYIAPGIEHQTENFRFSAGYQKSIFENVSGFAHYQNTFGSCCSDWSLFAGVQIQLGGGVERPFDFTMPNRIRARQIRGSVTDIFVFDHSHPKRNGHHH